MSAMMPRMDFEPSDRCQDFSERLTAFMDEHVYPAEAVYEEQLREAGDPHVHPPVMEELKEEARRRGLWNLFHPDPEYGPGLTNLEYAPLAEIMGRSHIGPEACNCSAPDTGNMEVLTQFGTAEQKEQWLRPLLDGEIRSAFAMTEPDVASSDATNIAAAHRARRRRVRAQRAQVVDHRARCSERCRIFIVMGKTNPDGPPHQQQSMILVPRDTPGVTIVRNLPVFGYDDQRGPRRGALRGRPRAGREPHRRRGRRLHDRPGAARPRPHPPLHAHDRRGRARARADVPARASSA